MEWNRQDVAEALGLSPRRIRQLYADGVIEGSDPKKVTRAYVEFLRSRQGSPDLLEQRARLTRIQADRKQLDLDLARGDVLLTETAMMVWGEIVQVMRSKLLNIPSKLSPLVFGCRDLPEMKDVIEKSIHEVMNELANPDLRKIGQSVLARSRGNRRDAKAPSKIVGQRVGRRKKGAVVRG